MVHKLAGTLSKTKINAQELKEQFFHSQGPVAPVRFGTSGHRGQLGSGFCALHARAIAQAVARLHLEEKITGPILVGGDTRLMSADTAKLCAQVLAGNGLRVILPEIPLPTPVFSFEILSGRACACLNGTASHNPPQDMGLKYNPSTGGPADSALTKRIEDYANQYLQTPAQIKEIPLEEARAKGLVVKGSVLSSYVEALGKRVDFDVIAKSPFRFALHPLGGASLAFYEEIKKRYQLNNVDIVSKEQDPTFSFIPLDHDGQIRMDPSSPYPMKPLIDLVQSGQYQFAGASDPDGDRFGCATHSGGLIQPNHALCVMAQYLLTKNPPAIGKNLAIGRTLGTTALLDRIAEKWHIGLDEENVGFKYFVNGLLKRHYVLAGEESAGMSVSNWTTEKDGILAVCLLMEIQAKAGDIAALYKEITVKHGTPHYTREDVPTTDAARERIKKLKKEDFAHLTQIAGEKVTRVRDTDGIKIYLQSSWFLVRPSGTENILKFYAETFLSEAHLHKILAEAQKIIG